MPDEQTNSQRRFTVIALPVFSIVKESLLLPFKYLPELVKFGAIPFLLILAADGICFMLDRQDVGHSITGSAMAIAHFILFTPFSVAWTRLALFGRPAVANHPRFAYSRTQWLYLLATIAMLLLLIILVGIPATMLLYGQRTLNSQMTLEATTLLLVGLLLYVVLFFRLAFIFPALVAGRYAGISAAWKQTAGNLERLAAIVLLSYAPYYVVRRIFEWLMGYHPPGPVSVVRGIGEMLLVAMATTALAAPALAYKMLVLDQHEAPSLDAGVTSAQ
jgi:hypothetical protein